MVQGPGAVLHQEHEKVRDFIRIRREGAPRAGGGEDRERGLLLAHPAHPRAGVERRGRRR